MSIFKTMDQKEGNMDVNARKLDQVQRLLLLENEEALDRIDEILDENIIVAHTVDGRPLNRQQYIDEIEEGREQARQGKGITTDELREKLREWNKDR